MPTMLFTSPATCSVYIINSHVRRHLLLHIWNAFDVRLISVTHLPFAKYVDTYCFHSSAWNVIVVTSFMSWPNTQYGRTCLHILSVYWNEIILWALLQNESINVNVATFVSSTMRVLCVGCMQLWHLWGLVMWPAVVPEQQTRFRATYVAIIQYDAGRLNLTVFVNCRVQDCKFYQ